jgi:hypothetical protein
MPMKVSNQTFIVRSVSDVSSQIQSVGESFFRQTLHSDERLNVDSLTSM